MKKFTCSEMGGPCGMEFEGETMQEVAIKGGQHVLATNDEAHREMREQMQSSTEDEKQKWATWFEGVWNSKA